MEHFKIDEKYLVSVNVQFHFTSNGIECGTQTNVDHPSFDALREHLDSRKIIKIERKWWNGDRALEDFTLNDFIFHKGDKFVCASAMKGHMKLNK